MRFFKTDLIFRYFKITTLIIFIFSNSIAFSAVSSFDRFKLIPASNESGQSNPTGVVFKPDGTKMYIIGINANRIIQYNLTTAFNISTAGDVLSDRCNLRDNGSGEQDATMFRFNPTGTKIFVLDTRHDSGERVDTYKLTTAYDISTCVFESAQDFTGEDSRERRSLAFSKDGMTFFIYNQGGTSLPRNYHSIKQYSLSSPFDLTNITLVTEYLGPNGQRSLNNDVGSFAQGLQFNPDGTKMYITESKGENIGEFTLSSPFDLTGNVTFEGVYSASDEIDDLAAIIFNDDGMKMYLMDWKNGDTRGVHEYSLTCSYGVIKCLDPSTNKDDVATIQSQNESSKKLIKHSTSPVLNRMQWLRRNENRANLTNQNIKFQFNNEILNSLSKTLIPVFFSNDGTSSVNSEKSNWSLWSEGTISIGKAGNTSYSSAKDISSTAITFGADRRDENNIMRGIAVRLGNDDVDVGDLGSALDMKTISFTFYGTTPKGDNKFADTLIGISYLNSDLINSNGSLSTTGERNGMQVYGSYNFRDTYNYNYLNYTPKIKFDFGGTHLESYSEKGKDNLTYRYQEQFIGHLMTTVGTSLDNSYELNNKSLIPYLNLDYTADISPSSSQKFTHISTGENFVLENINNTTHNFHAGIGLDLITDKGLNLMTKYTMDQSKDGNKRNFVISADYRATYNSSYALSVNETATEISYKSEHNNLNFDVTSNLDFFADDPKYGIYLKVYTLK